MKKLLAALLLLLLGIVFFWYRNTTQYKPLANTLIVGTSADFYPFSFRDKDDQITGFDIDMIKEVARRLGMDTQIQDRPFALLLPQIQLGQIHVIAAGMTPTEERAKKVYFTKPYLTDNPLLVLSLKDKTTQIEKLEDLKGKDVIVNTGYISDLYMSKFPDINLVRLTKVADAFTALDNNKAYAFVTAAQTIKPYLKDLGQQQTKFNLFKIIETEESSALAISKTLPKEFAEQIQKILDEMEADGTIQALKLKWEIA